MDSNYKNYFNNSNNNVTLDQTSVETAKTQGNSKLGSPQNKENRDDKPTEQMDKGFGETVEKFSGSVNSKNDNPKQCYDTVVTIYPPNSFNMQCQPDMCSKSLNMQCQPDMCSKSPISPCGFQSFRSNFVDNNQTCCGNVVKIPTVGQMPRNDMGCRTPIQSDQQGNCISVKLLGDDGNGKKPNIRNLLGSIKGEIPAGLHILDEKISTSKKSSPNNVTINLESNISILMNQTIEKKTEKEPKCNCKCKKEKKKYIIISDSNCSESDSCSDSCSDSESSTDAKRKRKKSKRDSKDKKSSNNKLSSKGYVHFNRHYNPTEMTK